jgi:hypothetical protein
MKSSGAVRAAVVALGISMMPAASQAGVFVSITVAPPVLPVYTQPICPGDGFLWTPGYWAYGDEGYFWVPGVWVRPPRMGVLWTPGYWGWSGGVYAWNAGYWGPHVGFYGGVNYGFGFGGVGFVGGRWEGGHFAYNSAVANINTTVIHNSYHTTVVENNVHTSFNGGSGGLRAQPNAEERSAMHESHVPATAAQTAHHEAASHDRSQLASVNHGRPANAAMSRPLAANVANANHASNQAVAIKPAVEHKQTGAGGQAKGNNKGAAKPAAHASHPAKQGKR